MYVRFNTLPALVLALAAATAASADTRQLAASAGIDASKAATLTVGEIVALKINGEARQDDRRVVVIPGASGADRRQLAAEAGVSASEAEAMSLTELAMAKAYREARGQDRVAPVQGSDTAIDGGAGRAQIIASIGLDPEIGRAMTLHEIYLAKMIRDSDEN